MLGASNRVMEVYRIKLNSVKGNFEMEAEAKVEKLHLMMVDNPRYKKLIEKHPHLKGVTMDDKDERPRLPVHIILGNSECPRISTTEPQRWEENGILWQVTQSWAGLSLRPVKKLTPPVCSSHKRREWTMKNFIS